MANHIEFMALLVTVLGCLPAASMCARVAEMTGTVANTGSSSSMAATNADSNYCPTDFSQVSFNDVKTACPTGNNQGASPACCAAFNNKACQYEAQVNNFGSPCPMMFVNYLAASGPYPAGYFVGPCVDGTKGICVRN